MLTKNAVFCSPPKDLWRAEGKQERGQMSVCQGAFDAESGGLTLMPKSTEQ